ncbi:hypothetical protein BTUL_0292g00100 [Botrytis tulipae]|uniref:Cytochrome P450 n=1 Tax=Botrytis tulipae TaxID=87230 RepID=A0A4Z1E5F3_9HELO|nr:hypothetical protein BTUL_0292g00100 [Botrytis tulipae]
MASLPSSSPPHPLLIPNNTGVGFSPYLMHRSKKIYNDDANIFRPERWEGSELKGIGWRFMPFDGGPRIYLGQDFALMEASYAVVRIIQNFPNMRLPPGIPVYPSGMEKQTRTIVVSSAEGCKVLL